MKFVTQILFNSTKNNETMSSFYSILADQLGKSVGFNPSGT
jgi:hypothetical protein